MKKQQKSNNHLNANGVYGVLGTVDYSKITLCPALNYTCYCGICGKCEFCSFFHTNKGENCKGCGANYKNESLNIKAKYENTKF